MIVAGGPARINGTILGYAGYDEKNNRNVLSLQLELRSVWGGPRILIIPIPGVVRHLDVTSYDHKDFFKDIVLQCDPSVIKMPGLGNFEDMTPSDNVLQPLYVRSIKHIISVVTTHWGNSINIEGSLINMLTTIKPGWGAVIAKFDNEQSQLTYPMTIQYDGPTLINKHGKKLYYFPGVQNLKDEVDVYFGPFDPNAVTTRKLLVCFGVDDNSRYGGTPVEYRDKELRKNIISNKIMYCPCHETQTINGDMYYVHGTDNVSWSSGMITSPIDLDSEKKFLI